MVNYATILGLILAIGPDDASRTALPDLVELRAVLANEEIPVEDRARRALEGASALDLAALQSSHVAERRARWVQAIALLDEFLAAHSQVESATLLRFQAAVYRWAEGRSFAEQSELAPADPKLREGAIRALDDSIARLKAIDIKADEKTEALAQNIRFRHAQSMADRSKLEPEGSLRRTQLEREALALLDGTLSVPSLRPFARLLRSELAYRLGLFGQAQIEVEQAEKLTPPPPAEPLLEAKVAAFCGRNRYEDARKAVETSKVGEPLKRILSLRIILAQRREKPPGQERKEFDAEAFRVAERSKAAGGAERQRVLMDLARTIDEPTSDMSPDWWELLAEGQLRLGDPVRAGRLVAKGGDLAESAGLAEKANALHYKAGAYLFEAGKFAEADRRLTQVVDRPTATRDLKAKAGMLRALARGRAVATREPGASGAAYLEALEAQVRDFPDEPATGEARWLLGQIRQSASRVDDAMKLWAGIPHGHARWLESRKIISDRQREAVETQRINHDSSAVQEKMEVARKSLGRSLEEATEAPEVVVLTLELARLELIPEVGKLKVALESCERVLKLAANEEQHQRARLYRMVALAESNRAVEAEKAARAEVATDRLENVFPSVRLLDRAASEAESDVIRRRIGLIDLVITSRLIERLDQIPETLRDEAHLQHARALLLSGNQPAARKEIAEWGGPVSEIDDALLRELADTYHRLDAHALAIDAERYRSGRLVPGSLPWFESRYGMALAYFRAERFKDARQLIDATAILHPDLGGGDLKTRFERLRQKIGQD